MKPIFFALILLSSITLHAQKFEVGVNGGIICNTIPTVNAQSFRTISALNPNAKPSIITPTSTLNISYNNNNWQTGLAVGIEQLSYKFKADFVTLDPYALGYQKLTIASDAIPMAVFLNREIEIKKLRIYGGISAGYVLFHSPAGMKGKELLSVGAEQGNGYLAGAQLGADYSLSHCMGLNLQAAGQYMWLKTDRYSCELIAFPITFGIYYQF